MKKTFAIGVVCLLLGTFIGYRIGRHGFHLRLRHLDGDVTTMGISETREGCEQLRMLYSSAINYDELKRTGQTTIHWTHYDHSTDLNENDTWCEER